MGSSVCYGTGATKDYGYAYMYTDLLKQRKQENIGKDWTTSNISIGGNTTQWYSTVGNETYCGIADVTCSTGCRSAMNGTTALKPTKPQKLRERHETIDSPSRLRRYRAGHGKQLCQRWIQQFRL